MQPHGTPGPPWESDLGVKVRAPCSPSPHLPPRQSVCGARQHQGQQRPQEVRTGPICPHPPRFPGGRLHPGRPDPPRYRTFPDIPGPLGPGVLRGVAGKCLALASTRPALSPLTPLAATPCGQHTGAPSVHCAPALRLTRGAQCAAQAGDRLGGGGSSPRWPRGPGRQSGWRGATPVAWGCGSPSTARSGRWAGGQPRPVLCSALRWPAPRDEEAEAAGEAVAGGLMQSRCLCEESEVPGRHQEKQPRAVLWAGGLGRAELGSPDTGPAREKSALGAPSSLTAACPAVTTPASSAHGPLACDVSTRPRGRSTGRSVANVLPVVWGRAISLWAACVVTDGRLAACPPRRPWPAGRGVLTWLSGRHPCQPPPQSWSFPWPRGSLTEPRGPGQGLGAAERSLVLRKGVLGKEESPSRGQSCLLRAPRRSLVRRGPLALWAASSQAVSLS